MKVLYLSYDGLLDPLGRSQILPYIERLQDKLEVSFYLLTFEKRERWRKEGRTMQEYLKQRHISWYPLSFTQRPPLIAKAYDSFRFYWSARRIVQREEISLLHARSYVAGWVAHQIAAQQKIPWIFDMRGFWADERRETGAWPAHNPFFDWLYKIWKKRERHMLGSAAHVVVLTEAARQELETWGVPSSKITVIPCVADFELFRPRGEGRRLYRNQLGIPEEAFVLGYVGSIGALYEVRDMLRFFERLLRQRPDSFFVFFTPADPTLVSSFIQEVRLPAERIKTQYLPHTEVPKGIEALDASVIFYRPGFSRKGCSPVKISELLAMNVPVVAQADLGDQLILSQKLTGLYLVQDLSPHAYDAVITRLLQDLQKQPVQQVREWARPHLALEVGIEQYEK
ncbi:MAG: glycosyltransferase, partial [Bacteroidia bacterium]|nr:glycosyltransferase [Bacteroidia bacterium]